MAEDLDKILNSFPEPSFETWIQKAEEETGQRFISWEPYQYIKLPAVLHTRANVVQLSIEKLSN